MSLLSRWLTGIGLLLMLSGGALFAQSGYSDPSGRVARLNHLQGEVAYAPAGEDEWLQAERNRPIIRGDRLWTERGARAELQVGNAAVRLGPETSFEILELDDRFAQLQMTQGAINLSVRRLRGDQTFEIATPNLVFTVSQAGRYRLDFDPRDQRTTVTVWRGTGDVYGDGGNFPISTGESVRFYGTDLGDYELTGLPRTDQFDRYCMNRDQRMERSVSLRYLDDDVIGYLDLDEHGRWRAERNYGNVWYPNQVSAGWAPYRDGHWVWQEPWGWTWVDHAPWGFAPSHYGRWIHLSGRWGWIPGPRNVHAVYAPALVAFVGGRNWSLSISLGRSSPIGWFPLGPREPYYPSYQTSRDYFTRVNISNTTINTTIINNTYNNYAAGSYTPNQTYINRSVAGALTAVPSDVFVNSRPVRESALQLDQRALSSAPFARHAAVAPSLRSVLGAGNAAHARPAREALDRSVLVRTAPPAEPGSFRGREQVLQRTPGLPPVSSKPATRDHRETEASRQVRILSEQRDAPNLRDDDRSGDRGQVERQAKPAPANPRPGQIDEPVRAPVFRNPDAGKPAVTDGRTPSPQERNLAREQAEQARQMREQNDAALEAGDRQARQTERRQADEQIRQNQQLDATRQAREANRARQTEQEDSARAAEQAERTRQAEQQRYDNERVLESRSRAASPAERVVRTAPDDGKAPATRGRGRDSTEPPVKNAEPESERGKEENKGKGKDKDNDDAEDERNSPSKRDD